MTRQPAGVGRSAWAIALRPTLWSTAVRQAATLVPSGWRFPGNPLPDPLYLQFRAVTQYGDVDHALVAIDVISYLSWCKAWRRSVAAHR